MSEQLLQIGPGAYLPPPSAQRRPDGSRHYVGVTYAAPIGYRPLQLDVWVPDRPVPPPLVVWIHGGGFQFGDRRHLPPTLRPDQIFQQLMDAGLAVATLDYRLAREAPFPAQLHDAKAAIRYLRAHAEIFGVDTHAIGVWGESAGGHLAALVGLTAHRPDLEGSLGVVGPSSSVDAVVDWYGVSDIPSLPVLVPPPGVTLPPELREQPTEVLLAGVDEATRRDASPTTHVHAGAPPFLLAHGTADPVVPHSQSEALASALRGAGVPVRLVSVPEAGHVFRGCEDIDAIVHMSVDYLAEKLLRHRDGDIGKTGAPQPASDRRAFFEGFIELMYRRRDVRAAFDGYVAAAYIQHNPGLPDGRDVARDALAEKFSDPAFSVEVVRMLVDGDLCALHLRARREGDPGGAVVDIYRADGDRIVEHWDVIQPWPAQSANDHPMF